MLAYGMNLAQDFLFYKLYVNFKIKIRKLGLMEKQIWNNEKQEKAISEPTYQFHDFQYYTKKYAIGKDFHA